MERSLLVLRDLLHLTVKLRSRSLIYTAAVGQSTLAHSLEHTQHTRCVNVGRELRRVEAHLHMALSRKVVYLGWLHLVHHLNHTHRVAQVGIVKMEMRTSLQMSDALTEIHRRATDCAVHIITFFQQELGEERTVLTGNTCNQCYFSFHKFNMFLICNFHSFILWRNR